jgi:hypothetical protein
MHQVIVIIGTRGKWEWRQRKKVNRAKAVASLLPSCDFYVAQTVDHLYISILNGAIKEPRKCPNLMRPDPHIVIDT